VEIGAVPDDVALFDDDDDDDDEVIASAPPPAAAAAAPTGAVDSRGLHSFHFLLNLSSHVHRVTQLDP
jgi:hypothetical protein